MNKSLSKRERLILYILIGGIFLGLNISFIIEPVVRKNRILNNEINVARLKIKKYFRLLKKEKDIQAKYSKLNLSPLYLEKPEDRLVSVLYELEKIAKNANIQIIDMRPETSQELGKNKEISLALKTEASIEGYIKFIYDIENSQFLLRIKKFQLNAKSEAQVLEGIFSIIGYNR
jgi:hypothetical protein